ncbi:MAG: hypothetical protein M3Y83_06645, partial [Actinomycetota bacterium]|nr:hypothetical protein [Actinomycetota bacterium]
DLGRLAELAEFRPAAASGGFFGGCHEGAKCEGAGLEAHASRFTTLDDGYGRAQPTGRLSHGKTGRSGADDA